MLLVKSVNQLRGRMSLFVLPAEMWLESMSKHTRYESSHNTLNILSLKYIELENASESNKCKFGVGLTLKEEFQRSRISHSRGTCLPSTGVTYDKFIRLQKIENKIYKT